MPGKFELKTSSNGKFHFNLKAGNGQIIFSSEMYDTKAAAETGIASVVKNAGEEARYERRKAANDEPFFVLKAGNGEVIGRSETYSSDAALENGIESVKTNAPGAKIEEI